MLMNCFTGKPATSTKEEAEKQLRKRDEQRSDLLQTGADFWEDEAPALSSETPVPLPSLWSQVGLVLRAGNS